MHAAVAAALIKNLLLSDFDRYIERTYPRSRITVGPVRSARDRNEYSVVDDAIEMRLEGVANSLSVYIRELHGRRDAIAGLYRHMVSCSEQTRIIISNFFKKLIRCSLLYHQPSNPQELLITSEPALIIECTAATGGQAIVFELWIPTAFFRYFSTDIGPGVMIDTVLEAIERRCADPFSVFPSIAIVLETYRDEDIQDLLYQLHKRNQLSIYQLCLLITAFPEHALRIKKNIAPNLLADIQNMRAQLKAGGGIQQRDIAQDLYAIEESMYFWFRSGSGIGASFLAEYKNIVKISLREEMLAKKPFSLWLREAESAGLLYKIVTKTDDSTLALAFAEDPVNSYSLLERVLSRTRIAELKEQGRRIPGDRLEIRRAQALVVSLIRQLKAAAYRADPDAFTLLIRRLYRTDDCARLLLETGWFTLSTAMKGMGARTVRRFLENISERPRQLIEDVLSGSINPNILHDESQVNRARTRCVRCIVLLYEEGMLDLSDVL